MAKNNKKQSEPTRPPEQPALVTVRVLKQPLYEADGHHAAGETFQTTAARAAALAALVEVVPD